MTFDEVSALVKQRAEAGQTGEAIEIARQVLTQAPNDPRARRLFAGAVMHDGISAAMRGKMDHAKARFDEAIAADPDNPFAHNNLGNLSVVFRKFKDAELHYRRALALKPDLLEAMTNLALVLQELNQLEESAQWFEKAAAASSPGSKPLSDAMLMLGGLRRSTGRIDEAVACLRRALAADPTALFAHSQLLYTLNLDDQFTPQQRFDEHVAYGNLREAPLRNRNRPAKRSTNRPERLRVGFVSADFRTHPLTSLMEPAMRGLDRSRFEVIGYSEVMQGDDRTREIASWCDRFADITHASDDEAAARIAQDQVDVLIDLGGHSGSNRPTIFARRPAHVAASWLGYPTTTGMQSIDFRITDAIADPVGKTESLHTEKLIRLDRCFLCFAPPSQSPDVSPPAFEKNGRITFGAFADLAKVRPKMLRGWAGVMKEVADSTIRLKARVLGDEGVRRDLLGQFASHGIAEERVDLVGQDESHIEHLRRHHDIDISLDTYPYNGTTTTCDSLWMGVPVITLAGETHVARVGASLLHAIGMDDLVAADEKEFVARAIGLARDRARLKEIRASLRERMKSSELMDQPAFGRAFESALDRMWAAD